MKDDSSFAGYREAPSPAASDSDPFKAMTRELDARIVARGGRSIFGECRMPRYEGAPLLDGKSAPTHKTSFGMAPGPGRPKHIAKPQRIMGHTYGILGEGSAADFDEMGW